MSAAFLVSVVVPVYNGVRWLERCIMSVVDLKQVGELIIIDDASTDATPQLIQQLISGYSIKIRHLRLDINQGVSVARNEGMKLAAFPFVSFLDADDVYLINRFHQTEKIFLNNSTCDAVYEATGLIFKDEKLKKDYISAGNPLLYTIPFAPLDSNHLFTALVTDKSGHLLLNGLTIRRDAWLRMPVYFDPQLRQTQDTDFLWTMSQQYYMLPGELKEPVAMRHIHGDNRIMKLKAEADSSYHSFITKWYFKSLNASFPKAVNRYLLKQFCGHDLPSDLPSFLIRARLFYRVLLQLFSHPEHWKKWV